MRIVHIEDMFNAETGYQLPLLAKFMAKSGNEVTIVTSETSKNPKGFTSFFDTSDVLEADAKYEKNTGVKIIRFPVHGFISGRAVFKRGIFKYIDGLSPDILYVHGNDTLIGMQYTWRLRRLRYPIVFDSHMLEMASENKLSKLFRLFYRLFNTSIITKNKIKVIRTQDDDYVEKRLGIPLTQSPHISVGSDTMLFRPSDDERKKFRQVNGIDKNSFVVIYAGKMDEAKGGLFLADAIYDKFEVSREVVFVIVGNTSGALGKKVEEKLNKSKNKVIRFPTQKYTDLASFYQIADLSIFPKQCSLSFFDVQACGLPVVSENNNINLERNNHNNGVCFESGDIKDIRDKIEFFANMSSEEYKTYSNCAQDYIMTYYDYSKIVKRYMEILNEEYNRFHNEKKDVQ